MFLFSALIAIAVSVVTVGVTVGIIYASVPSGTYDRCRCKSEEIYKINTDSNNTLGKILFHILNGHYGVCKKITNNPS